MSLSPTLLLVVDDQANLESLQRIFSHGSHGLQGGTPAHWPAGRELQVLCGRDGKEALELLRKGRIDVVLCDLMMPGMSGLDLLKAAQKISPETEVILMTAYGTVESAVEAMKDGAYDFI